MSSSETALESALYAFKSRWTAATSSAVSPRLVVGFSGGLDSTVLLHRLAQDTLLKAHLRVVHIHHGLHPEAGQWAAHCAVFCREHGLHFTAIQLELPNTPRKGLEAIARQARYEALFAQMRAGDWLVTAHHQRDQAETVLLNLARGAGVLGLAGMPYEKSLELAGGRRAAHVRPLLSVPYTALRAYAAQHRLTWVEDPSNQSLKHTRNRIRERILPEFEQARVNSTAQIAQCAEHMAEAHQLLEGLAQQALSQHGAYSAVFIDLNAYAHLDDLALKNLLRYWARHVANLALGSGALAWVLRFLRPQPHLQAEYRLTQGVLKLFKGKLYYLDAPPTPFELPLTALTDLPSKMAEGVQQDRFKIVLPAAWLAQNRAHLWVCSLQRVNGLSRKLLKNAFQQAGVPEWFRAFWPVLMHRDAPLAVWGVTELSALGALHQTAALAAGTQSPRNSNGFSEAWSELSLTEAEIFALCTRAKPDFKRG